MAGPRIGRRSAPRTAEGFLQVGTGARLDGTLEGRGLALIHGELTGEIRLDGEMIVARDGRLARLRGRCGGLRIEGDAEATLRVSGNVTLAKGGRLTGEVEAHRIDTAPGARCQAVLRIAPAPPVPHA